MIFKTQVGQYFEPEVLRKALVTAFGETGWHINCHNGNTVEFFGSVDPTTVIEDHFNTADQWGRAIALEQIKAVRQKTLDLFVRSPGVKAVYEENLKAAQRFTANDTAVMLNGQTPTQYLTDLGLRISMNASDFANHILAENSAAALAAVEVEKTYLQYAYQILPATAYEDIPTLLADYAADMAAALA